MSYTETQSKALVLIPKFSASMSIFGSSCVIYMILKDKKSWGKPYQRLLFAMSVNDVVASFFLFLSTWPVPEDSGRWMASGNEATCRVQGFFNQFSIINPMYNGMIALVYLAKIRYSYSDENIGQFAEPCMHAVAIAFALGTASTMLGLDMLHDSGLWCWINATPPGCKQTYQYGYTTCEAGDNAGIFRWAFFYAPIWTIAIVAMVAMGLIWHHVRTLEKRSSQWDFERELKAAQAQLDADDAESLHSICSHHSRQSSLSPSIHSVGSSVKGRLSKVWKKEKRKADKSQIVAGQGIRYCAVFIFTWSFGTVSRLAQMVQGHGYFWLSALHASFNPMQGFFNFLVFMYPKYQEYQTRIQKEKERSKKAQATQPITTNCSTGSIPTEHVVTNKVSSCSTTPCGSSVLKDECTQEPIQQPIAVQETLEEDIRDRDNNN